MLLDGGAPDRASLSAVAILKIRTRPIDAKKLVLDQDAEVACPRGDAGDEEEYFDVSRWVGCKKKFQINAR